MNNPRDARYTDDSAWVRMAGDVAVMGITDYAQNRMGDMTHVELPEVGKVLTQGKAGWELESVKAVDRFHAPLSGQIVERNDKLLDEPTLLNQDCYGAGWILKVRPANVAELDSLMTAEQYDDWERRA